MDLGRQVGLGDHAGADGVVDVVAQVGDAVGEPTHLTLERGRQRPVPAVVDDAVAHLPREVQRLELLDHPQALERVAPRPVLVAAQRLLAHVAERRVAHVVAQADRLGEVLVEAQRSGDRAGDAGDLERVGEPHAVVVALGREEDLRLVLQPAERLGVHHAVAVALELGAHRVGLERALTALRLGRPAGAGREVLVLPSFPPAPHVHSRVRRYQRGVTNQDGPSTACADASRAIGTRNGEQDT